MKQGKEPDQAVAYLDDGTMIVVNQARSRIGQEVKVVIDSVLHTGAGRLAFAGISGKTSPRARPIPASATTPELAAVS